MPDRVAFVVPSAGFLPNERVFPALGVLSVADAVAQNTTNAVDVLDFSGVSNYDAALQAYLVQTDVRVVGVTATTPHMPEATNIARIVRTLRPDIKLVLGGPHSTFVYAARHLPRAGAALRHLESTFDSIVAGDGEKAILAAIHKDAPKWLDADSKGSPYLLSRSDVARARWPERRFIDLSSYHYTIDGFPATTIIGQLGCPFGCRFCGGRHTRTYGISRMRSVESVVAEVEYLYRVYGYTAFMWYDDELNVSPSFMGLMRSLLALQERLGIEFRFRGFVKAELFTAEHARAMYRAGFRWLLCGFEAADDRILRVIRKRATRADNERCLEHARAAGIKIKALMSVGHPGESEHTVRAVRDWLVAEKVEDFDCTSITVYPGTDYYDCAVPHTVLPGAYTYVCPETGDRLHGWEIDYAVVADYYKGDPHGGYRSFVWTDHLSETQLVDMRNWVEHDVRATLGLPYTTTSAARAYEHSMGQGLPRHILTQPASA